MKKQKKSITIRKKVQKFIIITIALVLAYFLMTYNTPLDLYSVMSTIVLFMIGHLLNTLLDFWL